MGDEYWLVSVKNDGVATPGDDSVSKATVGKMKGQMQDCAQVYNLEMPELRVGTLEKLMSSGDLLVKVDMNVESVIRKIERQFEELNVNNEVLSVNGMPTLQYLENFRWNAAKYPTQRAVDELIKNIVQNSTKTETELKESSAFCTEKKQKVQALERQKDGNLMVADLNDILTPLVKPNMIHDSEYLKTVVVIVPKALEKDFLSGYEAIGNELVEYGPEERKIPGSPVVPRSAQLVTEDKDGYAAYLVTILKKFADPFKVAAQSSRFLVRDYDYKEAYQELLRMKEEGDGVDQLTLVKREYNDASLQLLHWCKTHYGDAFMAWIHIKAIRLFVESVLRYGLPVNYAAALVKPNKKSLEKKARDKLFKLYSSLDRSGMMQVHADDQLAAGGEEMFPYVSFKVVPLVADA
uniref:V-type proton ATPase subunit C n=1 Tax=Mucochytrium quahogii TaxID=96639 RepID=A0A7S2RRU2_9STRA|mmetsp:Transcript_4398/g.6553  ORF Transcript_4398/g.6553 Transcript_4398/m.6553 type:complete len:408 (-) Transcript_4398:435-1658(-)|eukprot:CAMPEP_0203760310 /NCGR_PEP_ID=MMETSP0098-20131031/13633_1 /ASSEMBLY_ACC=CAM_ASM_000208 /TAXON_ID=96639 /ORGANISM=" , Strain NY0313808BC1" /LENGTH=407 /DNA_ID=CAMNT_0050653821 /DNA_START=675 /DNA_END=1898 /DNA_ORIENTATION=-